VNGIKISMPMDETRKAAAPPDAGQVKLRHIARAFLGIGLASFSLAALGEAKNWISWS
jgi:hypothetical protein